MKQFMAGAVGDEGDPSVTTGVLIQGDDGTNRRNLQTAGDGDLKVTLDSESVQISDGGGTISVDDNGGSLTVDGGASGIEVRQATATDLKTQEQNSASILAAIQLLQLALANEGSGSVTIGVLAQGDDGANRKNLQTNAAGDLKTTLDGEAVEVSDGGGTLSVDDAGGSLTVDPSGGSMTVDPSGGSMTVDDGGGSMTVDPQGGVMAVSDNGTTLSVDDGGGALSVDDGGGALSVDDNGGSLTVDPQGGSMTVDGGASGIEVRQSTASDLKTEPAGNIAQDAADSGNPIKTGSRAVAIATAPSPQVASGDRVDSIADREGRRWVATGHPNTVRLHEKYTSSASADTVDGHSVASGSRFVVTGYAILVDGDCTVDALACTLFVGSAEVVEHPGIKPGSGVVENAGGAPIIIGGDGDEVKFTCEAPTGGSVTVQVSGYETPN